MKKKVLNKKNIKITVEQISIINQGMYYMELDKKSK